MADIETQLRATLEDASLSRTEAKAFRAAVADVAHDDETLARYRNTAFRIAEERITDQPHSTLTWLAKVDKIIDNARRQTRRARPDVEAAFTPGDDGLAMILTHLKQARHHLDVCVFTITDDRITQAVIDAHRRGVAVRVITDNDKQFDAGSDIHRLRDRGVPVRHDPTANHMHHKFAVIDRETLLTGSYNWTRGATRNHENLLALRDRATVKHFCDVFEQLWRAFA